MAKQILNEEFRRMQLLAGVITENEYKARINEEEYTLHLKNNHPNVNLDKKIKIDFEPTTMFGKWDEEELKQLFTQEKITSGTDIELIDLDGKVIKKGKMTGWSKDTPIISENQTDPTVEKDAEQGLKKALDFLKSKENTIKPDPKGKEIKEGLALTLGLVAGAPGLMSLLGKAVNFVSAPFQDIENQNKGTIVGNTLKKWGHSLEESYLGVIGNILKKAYPDKYGFQDVTDKTSELYDMAHGIYATILIGAAITSGVGALEAHSAIASGLEGGLTAFKTAEVVDLAKKIAAF